jgi:hypothetical protein
MQRCDQRRKFLLLDVSKFIDKYGVGSPGHDADAGVRGHKNRDIGIWGDAERKRAISVLGRRSRAWRFQASCVS